MTDNNADDDNADDDNARTILGQYRHAFFENCQVELFPTRKNLGLDKILSICRQQINPFLNDKF